MLVVNREVDNMITAEGGRVVMKVAPSMWWRSSPYKVAGVITSYVVSRLPGIRCYMTSYFISTAMQPWIPTCTLLYGV